MSQHTNNARDDIGDEPRDDERNATSDNDATGDRRALDGPSKDDAPTIALALNAASAALRASSIPDPRREAATLFAATIGRDRAYLFAHSDDALAPSINALFRERISRRAGGEPLQYITGHQEFFGLDFEVTPAVLIPRPETELLVEIALELLRDFHNSLSADDSHNADDTSHTRAPFICDVGTGSGCIPIALLHEWPDARAVAIDISTDALHVAARNAACHSVTERITFVASDLFAALDASAIKFDLITSNPPYVAEDALDTLQREVREHEPRVALTPGGDGLSAIRRLVEDAPRLLAPRGHLVFEIGHDQHEAVRRLIDGRVWTLLETRRDLQGIPRTVVLRLKR
ncbi:MAG: release factor glutamine methyltransferase [Acidobacteriota bacterium]|nr:release factor glutamine methyltransferase [Acidobacteriota bacterium]